MEGLKPTARLTVSQWAEKHRVLTPEASAEHGPWRNVRVPYLEEIMDCLSATSPVQEVTFIKGSQVGGTEAGNNWLGYCIEHAPGPFLFVMPTDQLVRKNELIRLTPMFKSSKALSKLIKPARDRDSGNTKNLKMFPGGTLSLVGANSASNFSSMPARYVMLDELDRYPSDVGKEGSPVSLARSRMATFGDNSKLYMISTPTIEGSSLVQQEFDKTDKRYYYVPCPECKHEQQLIFENLVETKEGEVMYSCADCGVLIPERKKTWMLKNGKWVATAKPSNPLKVGFHLNSLYSPVGWLSWNKIMERYKNEALKTPQGMTTFMNTILGKTVKPQSEEMDWNIIYNRAGDVEINKPTDKVYFLTAGVDVQKDRLEIEVVGWGKNMYSQSIVYDQIYGDTTGEDVYKKLDEYLQREWLRPDGRSMKIKILAIDQAHNGVAVMNFCRRYTFSRVMPIRGRDTLNVILSTPKAIDVMQNGKPIGRQKIFLVGAGILKEELYGFLKLNKNEDGTLPNGYMDFPKYDSDYFKGLTAEVQIENNGKYVWEKVRRRNEPVDLRVYARAAAYKVGLDRHQNNELFWSKMLDIPVMSQPVHAATPQQQPQQPQQPQRVQAPVRRRRDDGYWD